MKVAVESTVIFEVPDGTPLDVLEFRFRHANEIAIGMSMRTVTGQPYVLLALTALKVRPA